MTMGEVWRRLLFIMQFDRRTRELEEEMRLHVELRAERLKADGLAPTEAVRTARKRFGNSGAIAEIARDVWGGETIDAFLRELRVASRSLRRSPTFAITAATTLAIGLASSACIFTIVNAVLLRPLPFAQSDRVLVVQHALPGLKMNAIGRLTPGMFFTYGRLSKGIEAIAACVTPRRPSGFKPDESARISSRCWAWLRSSVADLPKPKGGLAGRLRY
jgi:hypothetical protein